MYLYHVYNENENVFCTSISWMLLVACYLFEEEETMSQCPLFQREDYYTNVSNTAEVNLHY